jgi:hypothetical protein
VDFIPRFSLSHHSAPYRHICVYCLFVGRNYPTSTRSTRISSRGLVSPTIHPPIVIYFHIAVHSVFKCAVFLIHTLVSTTHIANSTSHALPIQFIFFLVFSAPRFFNVHLRVFNSPTQRGFIPPFIFIPLPCSSYAGATLRAVIQWSPCVTQVLG